MAPWWHTGSSHLFAISIVIAGSKWEREREKRNKSLAVWGGFWGELRCRPSQLCLPTTSSRTSFQRIRLPVSCTKVTVILLWIP